ncbi:MAG: sodium:proton antiporter [Phycisphaeraceae bacterium]|nr:MAG: sodium:proton antiporter [Phycisphaeraceae bacterium]
MTRHDATLRRRRRRALLRVRIVVAGAGALALALLLVAAVLELPEGPLGLAEEAAAQLAHTGVDHAVTAVLLNYRSYDTWLEVGVLLLAVMAIFALRGGAHLENVRPAPRRDPLLTWLTRLLIPMLTLTAGYLLWLGKFAPGGAFQAGVVLGAAGAMLRLSGTPSLDRIGDVAIRILLAVGFLAFLVAAVATRLAGLDMLELPPGRAGDIILMVETLATISIATTCAVLVMAMPGAESPPAIAAKDVRKEART